MAIIKQSLSDNYHALQHWVKTNDRNLRRVHLLEKAAAQGGYLYTRKKVKQDNWGNTEYEPKTVDMKRLYGQYSGFTRRKTLKSPDDGLLWYTPREEPNAFNAILRNKRVYSQHRVPNIPYHFASGYLEEMTTTIPPFLRRRMNQVNTMSDRIAVGILAGVPATTLAAMLGSSESLINKITFVLTSTAPAGVITTLSRPFMPRLLTHVRHTLERGGFNVAKAIAFPQQTLKAIIKTR
jgi:hypothetical protein